MSEATSGEYPTAIISHSQIFHAGTIGQSLKSHLERLREDTEALKNILTVELGLDLSRSAPLYNANTPNKAVYSIWSWLVDYTGNLSSTISCFLSGRQAVPGALAIDVVENGADQRHSDAVEQKIMFIDSFLNAAKTLPVLHQYKDCSDAGVKLFDGLRQLVDFKLHQLGPKGALLRETLYVHIDSLEYTSGLIAQDLANLKSLQLASKSAAVSPLNNSR